MSVGKLDLASILGRFALVAKRVAALSETPPEASATEIPDPITLVQALNKAGVSLEWLLYGACAGDTDRAAPDRSRISHPPPVNLVLQQPPMVELQNLLAGPILTKVVREVIADWSPHGTLDEGAEAIAGMAAIRARMQCLPRRDYINASGIIIHTGWGNAPLGASAQQRVIESIGATPTGAANAPGRTENCARMLCVLTEAEHATVTTSNAASLLLASGALAAGLEIVVAARDLIEISDGARVRDIVEASGARVVPVGAANCVTLDDFRRSITSDTRIILRSHASNVSITGYAEHVVDAELGKLAHDHGLIYAVNLGGGSLVDVAGRGLPECPTVSQAIVGGADLVLASSDKLIGGPQAGLAVGTRTVIDQMMRHPLARTCRPGKLTLAALEGTLTAYVSGRAWNEIPTLRLLDMPLAEIRQRACRLAEALRTRGYEAVDAEDRAQCGGAVMPGIDLPTWTVRVKHPRLSEEALYVLLLARRVVSRRGQGAVIIDLRSVVPEDDPGLREALGIALDLSPMPPV
ncbi:MAG: L-seryl-tRNA(Sec) selenium transferase [Methyloceanibacter sp.]